MGPRVVSQTLLTPPRELIVPMKAAAWAQYYNSPSVPYARFAGAPHRAADGSLVEVFPTAGAGIRFNYLIAPQGGRDIRGFNFLSMTVGVEVVSGAPTFEFLSPSNQCKVGCDPVSARPMIWGGGPDLTSTTNRWWAHSIAWPLAAGKATIVVPLDGAQWSGVLGAMGNAGGKAAFAAAKAKCYALCITFGGGWYYGHGTDTKGGKARFQLFDYRLT